VPGLPLVPFALLGVAAGAAAFVAARRSPRSALALDEAGAGTARGPRLSLRLSPQLRRAVDPAALRASLAAARAAATTATGVPIPPFSIAVDDSLTDHEAAVAIDATPVAWFTGELAGEIEKLLPRLAPELLGVDRVAQLVERAAQQAPVTVREVVPKLIALPALAELLRELVREGLPIDDLVAILEAIATAPGKHDLATHVRGQLRRQISARWAPRGQISVFTVDAMIEDAVRTAIDRRDGTPVLALEPAIAQDIVAAVRSALGDTGVILASGDIRRHLRSLLEPELPNVAVLAAHELAPNTTVRTAGLISV
jgi:type III secretion protein V